MPMTPEQAAQPRIGTWLAGVFWVEMNIGDEPDDYRFLNEDGTWRTTMDKDGIPGGTWFTSVEDAKAAIARIAEQPELNHVTTE